MQSKLKGSNLGVNRFDKYNQSSKKKTEEDDLAQLGGKRNRTTSSIGMPLKHNLSEKFTSKGNAIGLPFLSTSSLAFGGLAAEPIIDDIPVERRQRGMSGMDDNNFFQLQQNTSNMIETIL